MAVRFSLHARTTLLILLLTATALPVAAADPLDAHIVVVHDPDGELARKYDLAGMPSAFLYDSDGKLVATPAASSSAAARATRTSSTPAPAGR